MFYDFVLRQGKRVIIRGKKGKENQMDEENEDEDDIVQGLLTSLNLNNKKNVTVMNNKDEQSKFSICDDENDDIEKLGSVLNEETIEDILPLSLSQNNNNNKNNNENEIHNCIITTRLPSQTTVMQRKEDTRP